MSLLSCFLGLVLLIVSSASNADSRWYSEIQVEQGAKLFTENCMTCHGTKAQGTKEWKKRDKDGNFPPPPLNGDAHAWHHSLDLLRRTIREGGINTGGNMPPFNDKLNKDQIDAVIAYFQSQWNDRVYTAWNSRNKPPTIKPLLNFSEISDENELKILVKKELERLLQSDGFLDSAIEKGINSFIIKRNQEAKNVKAQQQKARAKNIRPVDLKRDHIRGNPNAPITIIEYSDYECPFCKRFHPTVIKLLENNAQKLRWVYRHFPLGFHDPGATKQAEATECIAELGGNEAFWVYSDLIYKRTRSNGKGFPIKNLKPLAEEIGVDGGEFEKCLNTGKYTNRVKEDMANGKNNGVTGTPAAFILNAKGEMRFISGALPLAQIQALVDELDK